jgi:hypothetical protein
MNSRRFIRSPSQREDEGAEYHVSMVVALAVGENAASQMRRVAQDGCGVNRVDFGTSALASAIHNTGSTIPDIATSDRDAITLSPLCRLTDNFGDR